jgi:hypothetical protein
MTADQAARLAVCEQRIKEAEEDIRMLHQAMEGPPRDQSIRGRLHMLENSNAAALAGQAAVNAARMLTNQRKDRKFSRGETIFGVVFGAPIAASAVLTLVSHLS